LTASFDRRTFMRGLALAAGAVTLTPGAPAYALGLPLGPARAFSFDGLVAEARAAAARPYAPPATPNPAALDAIDYSEHWKIRFKADLAVPMQDGEAPVEFFHLGRYARDPVHVHIVKDGMAHEALYDEALFDMPAGSPARRLGANAGFAGLRVMRPGGKPDWLSFLGASYFRCDGPDGQYGLSARGLAIDTGLSRAEEFPRFSAFWITDAERGDEDMALYARLDSPSVTGVYRFGVTRDAPEGQRMNVESRLFFRAEVERLGIAPLTSMYWYSESNRDDAHDWRPEVHDSDGLAMITGGGERIWRPLRNPHRVTTASFFDRDPRGFGLVQRDRDFANYQDDGVFYNLRPSAWVTPKGSWGVGAVQLVEIPTPDEIFDNIVAYWMPETPPKAGDALAFDYTLEWRRRDPAAEGLARVAATRIGAGGVPGDERPKGVYKYVIDFRGGRLDAMKEGVEFEVSASAGRVIRPFALPIARGIGWRLTFDLEGAHDAPVDLRAYLRVGAEALTETWTMLADRGPMPG
jgi:glucans biosynthesis protein